MTPSAVVVARKTLEILGLQEDENARVALHLLYEILLPQNTRVSLKADKKAPKTDCLTTNMARSTSVAS